MTQMTPAVSTADAEAAMREAGDITVDHSHLDPVRQAVLKAVDGMALISALYHDLGETVEDDLADGLILGLRCLHENVDDSLMADVLTVADVYMSEFVVDTLDIPHEEVFKEIRENLVTVQFNLRAMGREIQKLDIDAPWYSVIQDGRPPAPSVFQAPPAYLM